jgi:UDP-N-acetylglucosamine 1-carboxyvinyltransferase
MREMGYTIDEGDDFMRVYKDPDEQIWGTNVKTAPYPGFPTDLQPQTVVLLCLSEGQSKMDEDVWENRYQYIPELTRMGANINIFGHFALINGISHFNPAQVRATDLRAGAALVCAELAADGTSYIDEARRIDRGYEKIVDKLKSLGADIEVAGSIGIFEDREA